MTQIDIKTLNHAPGELPEASEYVLGLLAPSLNLLSETKIDRSEFSRAVNQLTEMHRGKLSQSDFVTAINHIMDTMATKAELSQSASLLVTGTQHQALIDAINSLSMSYGYLKSAVIAMASKVDVDATPTTPYTETLLGDLAGH